MKKTSQGENTNFGDEFGDSKIFKPPKTKDRQTDTKFFLIDFDIWNIEIGVCMRKLWLFYERTPNLRTKRSESGKKLRRWLEIDRNGGEKTRTGLLQDLTSNKTSTRTQTQNCRLENLNMQRLWRGRVVGHKNDMAVDLWDEHKNTQN